MTKNNTKSTGQYAHKIALGHDYREAKAKMVLPVYSAADLATEVWLPVTLNTPSALEASSLGRIRLADDRRILPYGVSHAGYLIVTLPYKTSPRTWAVAPLVWSAWHPAESTTTGDDKPCVAFRDGDHSNVRPDNLLILPFKRALRRNGKCRPIACGGYVYPGAAEAAKALNVCIPTVAAWLAKGTTNKGVPIRFAPEYAKSMDGLTVRL